MRFLRILLPRCEAPARWVVASVGATAIHAVGAVVIFAVFGDSSADVVPPPHGQNSSESSASAVTLETSPAIKAEPSHEMPDHFEPLRSPRSTQTSSSPPVATTLPDKLMPPIDSAPAVAHSSRDRRSDATPPTSPAQLPTVPPTRRADAPRQPTIDALASLPNSGQLDRIPATIYSPRPQYPAEALAAQIEGRVVLRVILDREGDVTGAAVAKSSGHKMLDEAAQRSVAKWKFEPATRLGVRVATAIAVPVVFRIERN